MPDVFAPTSPDEGIPPISATSPMTPEGETVARLGAPNNRGTGRILYATGFESGANDWTPSPNGLGHSQGDPDIYSSIFKGVAGVYEPRTYRGQQSLKVIPDTVADANGDKGTTMVKLLAGIWSGNLGLEVTFGISPSLTHLMLGLLWRQLGGGLSQERICAILFDFANNVFKYLGSSGTAGVGGTQWVSLGTYPGGDMRPAVGTSIRWANLKLVLNADLTAYHRLYFNRYDFSSVVDGIQGQTSVPGAATFETLQAQLRPFDQNGLGTQFAVFDDVIVTQDEA